MDLRKKEKPGTSSGDVDLRKGSDKKGNFG